MGKRLDTSSFVPADAILKFIDVTDFNSLRNVSENYRLIYLTVRNPFTHRMIESS